MHEVKTPLIRLAKRDAMPAWQVWCIRGSSFIAAILLGALIFLVLGNNPISAYGTILSGSLGKSTAIRQTYPGVLVAPYLMLACSDSRHYCRICPNVYRFSGMPLSKEQRGMIHNRNERIPLSLIPDTVAFFGRVLERC